MLTLFGSAAIWFSESALWILFITGFLSATLLPGGSEASLIATLATQQHSILPILIIATIGNTLGGMTNYWFGLWLSKAKSEKKNRSPRKKYFDKTIQWLHKFGYWVLLLSWLPLIGDPLCFGAGWLRMKFLPSLIFIAIGKALRYLVLIGLYYGVV